MPKREKPIRRILNNRKTVSFDELANILDFEGCTLQHVSGSHHTYVHPDLDGILTVPYKRPHVNRHYVEQAIEWLNLEEKYGSR